MNAGLTLLSLLAALVAAPDGLAQEADSEPAGIRVTPAAAPAPVGSCFPQLASAGPGSALLLYLTVGTDGLATLQSCRLSAGDWQTPRTITAGTDWFVNWADFPTLALDAEGHLVVCWLQKLGEGPFDYGIRCSGSTNNGETFGEPFWLHRDVSRAEHGFPSLVARGNGRFAAAWLDGRDMRTTQQMAWMTVEFGADGTRGPEQLLDPRVCECCSTDLTNAGGTLIAIARDRSDDEIRDIAITRRIGETWEVPRPVAVDGWFMAG